MSRKPAIGSGAAPHARHVHLDPELRRRVEQAPQHLPTARGPVEAKRVRYASNRRPVSRPSGLRYAIEENLLLISAILLFLGSVGWCLLLYNQFRSSGLFASAPAPDYATASEADAGSRKSDAMGISSYMRTDPVPAAATDRTSPGGIAPASRPGSPVRAASLAADSGETAATIVARDWSFFQPMRDASQAPPPATPAKNKPPVHVAAAEPAAPVKTKPLVQLAAVEPAAPQSAALNPAPVTVVPRIPVNTEAKTSLVDFETAPFPYHGMVPGTERPFLSTGDQGHRGHVNFRGRVFWESQTFGDDRVLLHIPQGFDPKRPAVMVVFFHGHGATLARDVRDRQRLPEQISASGVNAVLVAPQFAVDAADSSAGKFWDADGFKHFLDEAAPKLAALYGDPRSAAAFANMPIVIVAYSGGFGPTLSVLARGGVRQRIRGLVLLDALYAGIDQFADWIANNRSSFFVSSYTPYTAHHNADLEHLLNERAVPYGSELRRNHLQGMVAFLPAGDVPHRDFVTHAWADNPVEDVLLRMDDAAPKIDAAGVTASIPAAAHAASIRN